MDFKELVQTEEFKAYRLKEIELGAHFIAKTMNGASPEYLRGALDMLSKVLKTPSEFSQWAPDTRAFMDSLVARDFALFEAKFLRRHLIGAEDD